MFFTKRYYICSEFFMVLDFKVNRKIGCRDDNQFFYARIYDGRLYVEISQQACESVMR